MSGVGGYSGSVVDDPATLDEMECRLRADLWDNVVEDAVLEHRIEMRKYGPMRAMLAAELPFEPRFNLLLCAAHPPAVESGHLADASEWFNSLDVDHYVPITRGLGETEAAEEWLRSNEYEPRQRRVRFIRDTAPPDFPEPAGLEVDLLDDYEEHGEFLAYMILEGFDLSSSFGTFYFELPSREDWRCYAAIDERELAIACAAMRIDEGIAQLAFDTTHEAARRRGCQLALLRRRIADAAEAGCHTIFAETEEPLEEGGEPSPAARNLRRTGFEQLSECTVWGPIDPPYQTPPPRVP